MEAKFICTAAISYDGPSLSLLKPVILRDSREHITLELLKERIEFGPGKIYEVIIRESC
jgi:hypothetical protein